ncbi:gephyrin-like molybdotransferase receptor GlpR [Streptomyces sp. NPDC048566]|uniref:divisome protein SepX/GlpR n=1 Tax=Streptomyces sp. NPDC048566 TaxID=3365569 RepID=UPI003711EBF9
MSSSGLIYAVIVGAWAAYLVPMWLRRQDELNEARPTERFSTAIRLLSGRAGMERRYARDLRARSADEGEPDADPDDATDSVDVRAFAMPPARSRTSVRHRPRGHERVRPPEPAPAEPVPGDRAPGGEGDGDVYETAGTSRAVPQQPAASAPRRPVVSAPRQATSTGAGRAGVRRSTSAEAEARARRVKVLARRRRTTVLLFLAFTVGAIVAAVGGLAFLWAPAVPAVLLSSYIVYLRVQERRRFTYTMDRQRAEVAAQRLRERQPRRRPAADPVADEPEEGPAAGTETGLSALAADRRALVEQTDHAEWVDQQRERRNGPRQGDSWDPVPVPLPTYVTAPVAPRATADVDLGAQDAWSSARSSVAEPGLPSADAVEETPEADADAEDAADDGRSDARRAASARRARERGRTPLFDQYEDGERPRAANE